VLLFVQASSFIDKDINLAVAIMYFTNPFSAQKNFASTKLSIFSYWKQSETTPVLILLHK